MSILYKKILEKLTVFFENPLNKDFPRNNPYKNINPNEGLNMSKPEINREKSQNINETLKKLRERVGN